MTEFALARSLLIVLLAAFAGGVAARKLKLPLFVGYLGSGIVAGRILQYFFPGFDAVLSVAEMGVVLLLFTLGLEFTIQKLKALGEIIILGSFIQIILTTFLGSLILPLFGLDFFTALFLSSAFSLSSTAVVVKTLIEKSEMETLHGEIATGWLFMQDLYTLPLMIVLPVIGQLMKGGSFQFVSLLIFAKTVFWAFLIFWIVLLFGKKLIPAVMEKIADLKSRELVTIAAVAVCFLFASLFQFLGFSFAVGAFVAGVLMASSSVRLGIFTEIRPLRDLFSVVFFVSLGFLIEPQFVVSHWFMILFLSLTAILLKFVLSSGLVFLLGFHTKTAFLVGASLVTVGEFSFILALDGVKRGLISQEYYLVVLTVSILTLFIGAPLVSFGTKLYTNIRNFLVKLFPFTRGFLDRTDKLPLETDVSLTNHVVVLGYGRVGKYICRALSFVELPFVVIDFDHRMVKKLRLEGLQVIYGDPADIEVLRFAKVGEAKAVILAYADRVTQEVVVANVFNLNAGIKLLCRTHFEEDQGKLKSLGVQTIVQPEFEAAVTMAVKLLKLFNIPEGEIAGKIKRLKIEHGVA